MDWMLFLKCICYYSCHYGGKGAKAVRTFVESLGVFSSIDDTHKSNGVNCFFLDCRHIWVLIMAISFGNVQISNMIVI